MRGVETTRPEPRARIFSLQSLRADAMAGLAVALMGVPQAMAYALIAGLPPVVGLYASIVPPIFAGLLGSSRYLITGPTNATALLIFSLIHPALHAGRTPVEMLPAVYLLSVISGLLLLAAGLLKLGHIIRYVAQSAMTGFMAAAGILIILGQLRNALGIERTTAVPLAEPLPDTIRTFVRTCASLGDTQYAALATALATFAVLWAVRRISPKLPAVLISLIVVGTAVWLLGLDRAGVALIRHRGDIPASLPPLTVPLLRPDDWSTCFSGGAALALLGVIEALTIAKGLAARTGDRINVNRELIGQGAAKMAAGFTGGMVPSGSQTRSAMNMLAGARTRFAQIASGIGTAAVVLALARPASCIPIPALSAVVIYSATGLIDVRQMRRTISGTRSDTLVLAATIAATVLLRLDQAIYVGAALSVLTALRHTSRLVVSELVMTAQGRLFERRTDERTGRSAIVLLQLEGSLYFGAADELETYLRQVAAKRPAVIVLRLKRAHHLDMTIAERLAQLAGDLRRRDITLVLCGLRAEVVGLLERTGLAAAIGPENLFLTDREYFGSVRRALQRGRELASSRYDGPHLRVEPPEATEDYVI